MKFIQKKQLILLLLVMLVTNIIAFSYVEFGRDDATIYVEVSLSEVKLTSEFKSKMSSVRNILNRYDSNGNYERYDMGWISDLHVIRQHLIKALSNLDLQSSYFLGKSHGISSVEVKGKNLILILNKAHMNDTVYGFVEYARETVEKEMISELDRIIRFERRQSKIVLDEVINRASYVTFDGEGIFQYRYDYLTNELPIDIGIVINDLNISEPKDFYRNRTLWVYLLINFISLFFVSFCLFCRKYLNDK